MPAARRGMWNIVGKFDEIKIRQIENLISASTHLLKLFKEQEKLTHFKHDLIKKHHAE